MLSNVEVSDVRAVDAAARVVVAKPNATARCCLPVSPFRNLAPSDISAMYPCLCASPRDCQHRAHWTAVGAAHQLAPADGSSYRAFRGSASDGSKLDAYGKVRVAERLAEVGHDLVLQPRPHCIDVG